VMDIQLNLPKTFTFEAEYQSPQGYSADESIGEL